MTGQEKAAIIVASLAIVVCLLSFAIEPHSFPLVYVGLFVTALLLINKGSKS